MNAKLSPHAREWLVVAALTWVIPAGRYDYNADGTPIPNSYHRVDQTPARILVD